MASHGVPRMAETPRGEEQIKREEKKIAAYKQLESDLQTKVQAKDFSAEAFELTSKILTQSPEYYTVWNHRRRMHQQLWSTQKHNAQTIAEDITADLHFIIPLMLKYPKCYWIWNYRVWLLEQSTLHIDKAQARTFWEEELGLVAKMLSKDRRNFHGWRYRRIVVAALESGQLNEDEKPVALTEQEFDYTTKMIHGDLSNFSAWHHRSILIPKLLKERNADGTKERQILDEELNLIHEALIDPYDSSLWFYHQCLATAMSGEQADRSIAPSLSQAERLKYIEGEITYVLEMLDGCDDCKWVFQALIDLSQLYRAQSGDWPPRVKKLDIKNWMSQLMKLDPLRRGRWRELEATLG